MSDYLLLLEGDEFDSYLCKIVATDKCIFVAGSSSDSPQEKPPTKSDR